MDSLILAIEAFNRPFDHGRADTVLIQLDHSFEMLLKAAILHRGGRIRKPYAKQTIGFNDCINTALLDPHVKFLEKEQALTLQILNGLRDASYHYLVDTPEPQLYLVAQASVTLFADLLNEVFQETLSAHLPERVLPVSTKPPQELSLLVKDEMEEIRKLLRPGTRQHLSAEARLRSLAIIEAATRGENIQPSSGDLRKIASAIAAGGEPKKVFPGISALELSRTGDGIPFHIRITKKEGVPVHLVPAGAPGAPVIAVKRVDDTGFYSLARSQLAEKVGLSGPKTTAVVRALGLQEDAKYFRVFSFGKSQFGRYSMEAVEKIKAELPKIDMGQVWREFGSGR